MKVVLRIVYYQLSLRFLFNRKFSRISAVYVSDNGVEGILVKFQSKMVFTMQIGKSSIFSYMQSFIEDCTLNLCI